MGKVFELGKSLNNIFSQNEFIQDNSGKFYEYTFSIPSIGETSAKAKTLSLSQIADYILIYNFRLEKYAYLLYTSQSVLLQNPKYEINNYLNATDKYQDNFIGLNVVFDNNGLDINISKSSSYGYYFNKTLDELSALLDNLINNQLKERFALQFKIEAYRYYGS